MGLDFSMKKTSEKIMALSLLLFVIALAINYGVPGCSDGGCGKFDSTTGDYEKPPPKIREIIAPLHMASNVLFGIATLQLLYETFIMKKPADAAGYSALKEY